MSRLGVRVEKLLRALVQPRRRATAVRRILVAHNLLLGDTVLLAPLLKALAMRYPAAERVVLARPAYVSLFEGRPYGATVLPFDRRDAASQRRVLRSGPYDLAYVPDDTRYAWLARAAGAAWITGFAGDTPSWKNWMLDETVAYPDAPQAWADMAATLTHLPEVPRYRLGEWPPPPAARAALSIEAPYVVLHVGASTPLKLWPAQRWRALADALSARGLRIVWSGGAGEGSVLTDIGIGPGEIDVIGKLKLAELWSLLAKAKLLICPDTGVAHVARIVSVPTVALFGPGSAVVHGPGRFWEDGLFEVVTDRGYPCRDQSVLFRREISWVARCGRSYGSNRGQCPRAGCMEVLSTQHVLCAVERLLELVR